MPRSTGEEWDKVESFLSQRLGGNWGFLLFAVIIIIATVFCAKLVGSLTRKAFEKLQQRDSGHATVFAFLRYIVIAIIYIIGISIILGTIEPLRNAISTALAASGVLAVVVGFAAQEALGSIVSGIVILMFKPFIIGDLVRYVENDITGVIKEITLHHTTIRTYENKDVIIPNSKMNGAIVENSDYSGGYIASKIEISVAIDAELEAVKQILSEAVGNHPECIDTRSQKDRQEGKPKVSVLVTDLQNNAMQMRVPFHARSNAAAFDLKCDALEVIKRDFERNHISMAFPKMAIEQKNMGK